MATPDWEFAVREGESERYRTSVINRGLQTEEFGYIQPVAEDQARFDALLDRFVPAQARD